MRPAGEIRQALQRAATELTTPLPPDRGATFQELAVRAQVGVGGALHTVRNMARAGQLCISGRRKVPYRNRPVAEYRPVEEPQTSAPDGPALDDVLAAWAR
jgi:hydroxyacyl-ACP dehydratase HTD2-like protein with hotdog domain